MKNRKRICVYCGSNSGTGKKYRAAAAEFGRTLAERGIGLVYGGGNVGLMGALADAALAQGGEVIGIIPEHLARTEVAHRGLTELRVVGSMHERKTLMASLADGFAALPGGYGTLDELCEILTWAQLGLHVKPCGVLDVDGYFDLFLKFLDHASAQGFIHAEQRRRLRSFDAPEPLLDWLGGIPKS